MALRAWPSWHSIEEVCATVATLPRRRHGFARGVSACVAYSIAVAIDRPACTAIGLLTFKYGWRTPAGDFCLSIPRPPRSIWRPFTTLSSDLFYCNFFSFLRLCLLRAPVGGFFEPREGLTAGHKVVTRLVTWLVTRLVTHPAPPWIYFGCPQWLDEAPDGP